MMPSLKTWLERCFPKKETTDVKHDSADSGGTGKMVTSSDSVALGVKVGPQLDITVYAPPGPLSKLGAELQKRMEKEATSNMNNSTSPEEKANDRIR